MRILMSLLLVLAFSIAASAQNKGKMDVEAKAEKMTEKMEKELQLTPDQKIEVLKLNKELMEKRMTNKMEMKAAREEHKAKMQEVLTEEQYKELERMRVERKDKFRNKHHKKD